MAPHRLAHFIDYNSDMSLDLNYERNDDSETGSTVPTSNGSSHSLPTVSEPVAIVGIGMPFFHYSSVESI